MANDFSARQWKIDTPYVFSSLPNAHPATVNVKIEGIVYTDYATQLAMFSVQDRNGKPIFEGHGDTSLDPIKSFKVGWANGIQVPTLNDSTGHIIIYLA